MPNFPILNRYAKAVAMLVALASSVYGYNCHDGFYFTQLMAWFISIVTGLLLIAYWPDALLRIITGCVFLCSLNNLYDELFGDPYSFDMNEHFFAWVIIFFTCSNLYKLYKQVNNGTTTSNE